MADTWSDRILSGLTEELRLRAAAPTSLAGSPAEASAGAASTTAIVVQRQTNVDTPLTVGADSTLWRAGSDDPTVTRLAEELIGLQVRAQTHVTDAIMDLLTTDDFREALASGQRPGRVVGRLLQPDGRPAAGVRVGLDDADLPAAIAGRVAATTTSDGSFVLVLPPELRDTASPLPDLVVHGGNRTVVADGALSAVPVTGLLDPVTLDAAVDPLPLDLLGMLTDLGGGDLPAPATTEDPVLSLGADECTMVFRRDTSSDRFPFSVMFRLSDPAVVSPTLAFSIPAEILKRLKISRAALLPSYGMINPLVVLAGALDKLQFDLVERVPISRPLSIDGFRDGLAHPTGGVFDGTPLAGSLAIGYVVHMAQRWSPAGLGLGDLVYSLPLAPGEQQRVAVVERTATSSVIDSETLETTEQLGFTELDDTSADATFRSAFGETASGGSVIDTSAHSSSKAGAGGIGLALGPVVIGGGVAASSGSSSSHGSTSTWMQGSRDTTSSTAQTTHAAVQRQASARRQASRTAMRLATASESDQVVTKVITNHNKTRALTVQYWEVLRLFDITTTVEGVSLICLVPLDVIRFLPAGQPPVLDAAPADRTAVLDRYAELIGHADTLERVVPARYRQGLSLITEFAGDPQAAVQGAGGDAEDVISLSLTGRFLPTEDLYVTVVSKRGLRTAATLLTGPVIDLPADLTADELLAVLKARRAFSGHDAKDPSYATTTLSGSVVLPRSIPRQDVAGFEITRRFRPLNYATIPDRLAWLRTGAGMLGIVSGLEDALKDAVDEAHPPVAYGSDQLESLLGGPPVTAFSAQAGTVQFATQSFSGAPLVLPRTAYPVSSRVIPPLLGYTAVLEIEKTLQWCVRNTMTCSVAVFSSLTPEERIVLLERYELTLPPDDDGNAQAVPLVSCVTNTVLGYFGNCMIMPFQIPFAATALTTQVDDQGNVTKAGLTTKDITDALTRFHTDGFAPPTSRIALPTKGVLGEAVLGHCPSAEKIDLTRFWNWQDSPADQATEIGTVTVPTDSLTAGLTAPSALTGLAPVINNFSTTGVTPDTSLAQALASAAAAQPGFDIAALTNADNLATVTGKTLDTAEAARKDALAQASSLAGKAMDNAVKLALAKKPDPDKKDASKPPTLSVFFAKDSSTIEDAPAGTTAKGQLTAIKDWAAKAKAAKASAVTVTGFFGSDDTVATADNLQSARASAVKAALEAEGVTGVTTGKGGGPTDAGSGTGGSGSTPADPSKFRRADATVTKTATKDTSKDSGSTGSNDSTPGAGSGGGSSDH